MRTSHTPNRIALPLTFLSLSAALGFAPGRAGASPPAEVAAGAPRDTASRCPTVGRAVGDGPLSLGGAGADFGTIPEACVGADVAVRLRGALLVAPADPDFYGNVAAAGGVRLRRNWGARWMLWLAADLATYRFVQNAAVKASAVDSGPVTLGVGRALIASSRLALTGFSRLLLPFDSARNHGHEFGADLGLSATGASAARPWLGVQGGAVLNTAVVALAGQAHTEAHLGILAETWASGGRWAGTLGGFGRLQMSPDPSGVSSIGARAGGRCAFGSGGWLAAVTELPLFGGDRTDIIFAVWAGYRPPNGRWAGGG